MPDNNPNYLFHVRRISTHPSNKTRSSYLFATTKLESCAKGWHSCSCCQAKHQFNVFFQTHPPTVETSTVEIKKVSWKSGSRLNFNYILTREICYVQLENRVNDNGVQRVPTNKKPRCIRNRYQFSCIKE